MAITITIASAMMKIMATTPPIMAAVLSEELWGREEVVLSVVSIVLLVVEGL